MKFFELSGWMAVRPRCGLTRPQYSIGGELAAIGPPHMELVKGLGLFLEVLAWMEMLQNTAMICAFWIYVTTCHMAQTTLDFGIISHCYLPHLGKLIYCRIEAHSKFRDPWLSENIGAKVCEKYSHGMTLHDKLTRTSP